MARSEVIPKNISDPSNRSKEQTHNMFKKINQWTMRTAGLMTSKLDYDTLQQKSVVKPPSKRELEDF